MAIARANPETRPLADIIAGVIDMLTPEQLPAPRASEPNLVAAAAPCGVEFIDKSPFYFSAGDGASTPRCEFSHPAAERRGGELIGNCTTLARVPLSIGVVLVTPDFRHLASAPKVHWQAGAEVAPPSSSVVFSFLRPPEATV